MTAGELEGPYVVWHERPERTAAAVVKPSDADLKALAKELAGTSQDGTSDAEDQLINARVISARTRANHPGYR